MFGKTITNKPIYYPLLASEEINGGTMSKTEIQNVWSRFDLLPEEKKAILTSEELPLKLTELQGKLGCDDASIEGVSVLIRWFFFGEIDEVGLRSGLQEVIGDKAEQTLIFIQKEILTIKPRPKVEEASENVTPKRVVVTVKLPLLQALSKYEQLGNQLITQERIKIRSQAEPVRPSLLYWIKYYRDELGVGHHDSVLRGNFLFRSENGKRLSPEERERVNLVLKSVEENFPVEIDTEQSIIVFPPFVPQQSAVSGQGQFQPPRAPQKASFQPNTFSPEQSGALTFSSHHVLPAEKAEAEAVSRPAVSHPAASRSNPFHIRPVSLGKDGE